MGKNLVYTPPESSLIKEEFANEITKLETLSPWLVILYQILTFGIYGLYWFVSRSIKINSETAFRVNPLLVCSALCINILTWMLSFLKGIGYIPFKYEQLLVLMTIISTCLVIRIAFSLRRFLNLVSKSHPDENTWTNALFTLFLRSVYLQYKINQLSGISIDGEVTQSHRDEVIRDPGILLRNARENYLRRDYSAAYKGFIYVESKMALSESDLRFKERAKKAIRTVGRNQA